MNVFLLVLTSVVFIGWGIAYFVFSLTGLIHVLVFIGAVAIVYRLVRGKTGNVTKTHTPIKSIDTSDSKIIT